MQSDPEFIATLSPRKQRDHQRWNDLVAAEGYTEGQLVTAARVIADHRDYVLHTWWEPARLIEIRNFDAVVKFADGTTQSSGLGLKPFELPTI
jgi:hypothetical protein